MRIVASKTRRDRWGLQTISLGFDGIRWFVCGADYWSFAALSAARTFYRSY